MARAICSMEFKPTEAIIDSFQKLYKLKILLIKQKEAK